MENKGNRNLFERGVYVYDPLDYPLDWLIQRGVRVTMGAPLASTGKARVKIAESELISKASGHVALLGASGAYITRGVMESLSDLRFILKLGIGTEVIDMASASEFGIMVANTPVELEVDVVAEHCIALMLGLLKRLDFYNVAWLRGGGWKDPEHMSGTLFGRTIGVVGFGHIGRAVAKRLASWGVRILVHDLKAFDPPVGVEVVDLDQLLAESDLVTLHVPGVAAGEPPLLDEQRLSMMKKGALLVNTARGNLVDTETLKVMLKSGQLAGAAFDVFNPEPPRPDDELLSCANVIATPHMAAWNKDLRAAMAMLAFENLFTMFEGGVPKNLVNPESLKGQRYGR